MVATVEELKAKRGYVKSTLTRLFVKFTGESLAEYSLELLKLSRQRCLEAFKEYEKYNYEILCINNQDSEDVAEYENKYFAILSKADSEINLRLLNSSSTAPTKQTKLPKIEIQPFTGQYCDYTTFRQLFNSVIDNNPNLDNIQRLHYLRSYLKNEPFDIIKNLPLMEDSYKEAIKLLDERYYNKYKIINEHVSNLLDLKVISKPSPSNLREFLCSVRQTMSALNNLGAKVLEWDPILMCIFTRKIELQTAQAFHLERDMEKDPSVADFLKYLEKRALAMENSSPCRDSIATPGKAVHTLMKKERSRCHYCKSDDHKTYTCKSFKLIPSAQRLSFAQKAGLCNICLNMHTGRCKFHFRCNQCKKSHHSLLHQEDIPEPVVMLSGNNNNNVLIPTARIKVYAVDGREVHIKAIMDSASQASLITSKAINVLGLTPVRDKTNIMGVTNTKNFIKYSIPIEVHSLKYPFKTVVNCHVVETITCKLPQSMIDPTKIVLPPGVTLADEEYYKPSEINMLIGADVFFQSLQPTATPRALVCVAPVLQSACGRQPERAESSSTDTRPEGGPRILNTYFGHIIAGGLPPQSQVNKLVSLHCTRCDIDSTISKFWETEKVPEVFPEKISEHELVENLFETTFKLSNNRFHVDLPLKVPLEDVNSTLGESFELALYRFLNLEKRLSKNVAVWKEYQKFIHQYIELGHAHFVDFTSFNFNTQPIYFLPHHHVINEASKTTRIRVVFDGSMKTKKKVSLNDILLNGPTVQRELFDIVLLYRIGDFTFNSDIKKMFRNILVNPAHASLQNILWRDSPNEPIKCIRLDTITYGLKSSSYLATRCLLQLAKQHESELPLAAFIIKNCVYVDDILYSISNLNVLLEAKAQLKTLLSLGGFEMHKWSSNHENILSDIPMNERQLDDIELQKDNCSINALGLTIDAKRDCFVIKCPDNFKSDIITKRKILSQIARFYDPLGFVSPIVVKAKVIMQKLWCENIDWDSNPSQQLQSEWSEFAKSLVAMEPIYINRNIHLPEDAEAVQLVGFSDASSSTGFGACLYLRVVTKIAVVRITLLCSKSRINPHVKVQSTPRLELNAALLLAKLANKVHDTLQIKVKIDDVFLFSDSQIALAWISTEVTKLQAYVSNRVRVIQQLTNRWRWAYVSTNNNPADYISRGVDPRDLSTCEMWWKGPTFLQDKEYKFSKNLNIKKLENLPEIKVIAGSASSVDYSPDSVVLLTLKSKEISDILEKYSDINKMKRILAYVLRFSYNTKTGSDKIKLNYLSSKELEQAMNLLIKHEQALFFEHELNLLHKGENVKGPLRPLHPFVDDSGLVRVGGRLQNSAISYNQKHPIILPKGSKLTELIISHEHLRLLHAGPKLVLAQLNQKYWLVNGLRQIKKITHKCLTCFRMKAECAKQLMGSLPRQRVTASRAFQVVGMDFAGPVQIKNSRIRRALVTKGYICVFVCFNTKAIHLELASDLTTETFLACFKRFISRRAMPSEVFCDNGSNFKGAAAHLADLYKLHNSRDHHALVQGFSSQQGIKFNFTPSFSPVFAALAESSVKSTKHHLKRTLQKSILTFEQLITVLNQIEAILNSRPLIPLSSDVSDFNYLTPGHFLVGAPLMSYPEPDISEVPINRLKFWQLVEKMKQEFWKAWHKQYLNTLQCRPKWRDDLPNICVGKLVLLREPNSPPLYWPVARITKVFPGNDGKVRAFEVTAPNGRIYKRSLSGICLLPIDDVCI